MQRFTHGDRVCFIGDSITAQNRYLALLVDFYKRNFPDEDIKIFNCGISGSSCPIVIKYFDEDVVPHNPTHIFIMIGVNDSSRWDLDKPRSAERDEILITAYKNYKKNLAALCEKAVATGAKVTLITPPPYDEYRETSQPAFFGGYELIKGYADHVKSFAAEKGYPCIDLFSYFEDRMEKEALYNDDHTHPNDLGHYHLAKFILQNQGLEIGEFAPFPDYIEEWRSFVLSYRDIYAVEHMCIKNDDLTVDEKVEIMKKQLDNKEYYVEGRSEALNDFFERLTKGYVKNKPRQAEMFRKIDDMYDNLKAE